MSTVSEGRSKVALDSAQREWLQKMGDVFKVPVKPATGVDVPLTGVFPEVLWEQRQPDVLEAELMLDEMEEAELPKAALYRKGIDLVRSLEKQKKYSEALKAFDALEPKLKAEYERFQDARGSGVQDLDGDGGLEKEQGEDGEVQGEDKVPGDDKTAPAPAPAADCEKYKKEILKVGSKGPAVECLQKMLGGGLGVDSKFGPATQKAVKAFQKSKGLKDDGIVGEKTWTALAGGAAAGGAAQGGAGGAAGGGAVAAETTHKTAPAGGGKGGAAAPSDKEAGPAGAAKGGAPAKGTGGFISASVGKGGKNLPDDVKAVQAGLNKYGGAKLPTDGKYGPPVLKAIEEFQKKLGQFKPSGLIEPNRGAARCLSGAAKIPPTPPEPKPIAPPELGKASLDKGAFVWHSTRGILDTNIKELKKGVRGAYGTEHAELLKAIDESMVKLGKVVEKLDTRLADALDAAYKAPNDQARVPELKKAESIMKEYLKYVKAEPLIGHMDDNPFGVKTSLMKVITDALKHLSQLLPEASAKDA